MNSSWETSRAGITSSRGPEGWRGPPDGRREQGGRGASCGFARVGPVGAKRPERPFQVAGMVLPPANIRRSGWTEDVRTRRSRPGNAGRGLPRTRRGPAWKRRSCAGPRGTPPPGSIRPWSRSSPGRAGHAAPRDLRPGRRTVRGTRSRRAGTGSRGGPRRTGGWGRWTARFTGWIREGGRKDGEFVAGDLGRKPTRSSRALRTNRGWSAACGVPAQGEGLEGFRVGKPPFSGRRSSPPVSGNRIRKAPGHPGGPST